ncbi:hypothetical protein BCR32DRAFT_282334 [Anaeromyces robustus]|uniref:Uncharacterized protein n=1 Tax=Anaeromyces robustus TaxID=1754192 RepID=A0A1Y1WY26_9FUNG|nr:hypothetical protein BCR32DRAFT_282334 [Anaeromyces robustus]|eukprot:ORX78352.1 hypothetical protein BCR32DRAFT_282334 [Anaeromyces robustus]
MKFSKVILNFALFPKSILGYEINIVKPEYQSSNVNLSDNIFKIIDKTVEDIYSYSINQNEIIFNLGSKINKNIIDLINIMDDDCMEYIGNNEIKVNYPVLSVYMDKYKNLYQEYDISINQTHTDSKENNDSKIRKSGNKEFNKRENVSECMNNVMIRFGVSCIGGLARCAAGGVGLMLGSTACSIFN